MYINNETLKLDYQVEKHDENLKIIDVLATSMQISSRLIRKCKNHKNIFEWQKRFSQPIGKRRGYHYPNAGSR